MSCDLSPNAALAKLKEGNARYVAGQSKHGDLSPARMRQTTDGGQHPYATVIGCSDSRCPAEHVFDAGIGDIFVIRVAGNVCANDEVGSAEYGVCHLGTPVLVVLGHTNCGAVTAVATGAEVHGCIPKLVAPIIPAVEKTRKANPGIDETNLIAKAIEENAWQAVSDLMATSTDIAKMHSDGAVTICAAVYDIATGNVNWLGEHPR